MTNKTSTQDVIGIVNESRDVFTLEASELTSSKLIRVSGIAPASTHVTVAVDGARTTTAYSNRAGNYSTNVQLSTPLSDQVFVISASCTNSSGETMYASKTISYQHEAPVLTGFDFYLNGSASAIDLYSASQRGVKPSVTYTGSSRPHKFEVEFINSDRIEAVYITSTRNNVKKSIEAQYDASLGKFVASGFFDDNKSYVPGTLGVEYTLKYEKPLVGQNINWTEYSGYLSEDMISKSVVTTASTNLELSGTIDFSGVAESLRDTALDYTIKSYDINAGTSINDWLSLAETELNVFAYIVPGIDDSRHYVVLDFRDPKTYFMIVSDGVDVVKTVTEMRLDMLDFGTSAYDNLFDFSTNLSNFATGLGVVQKTYGFIKDNNSLRDEIMQSSYIEDKAGALKKADELMYDQIAFTLLVTTLPLLVSGGVMAGPALLLSSMLGVMSSMSGMFWDLRTAQILGGSYGLSWHIDPSGYVYDIDTGERLEGVITTAYYIPDDDSADFWNNIPAESEYGTEWDASEYNQDNPLITDAFGNYSWDVPAGWWRVEYVKDGYETVWSEWLPVPPPQTDVNIGMVSAIQSDYSIKLVESTATSTTLSLTNHTTASLAVRFVIAAYDRDGKMVGVNTVDKTLSASGDVSLSVSYAANVKASTVKAFVLAFDTMVPLRGTWSRQVSG